jgi:hypothetical protein
MGMVAAAGLAAALAGCGSTAAPGLRRPWP